MTVITCESIVLTHDVQCFFFFSSRRRHTRLQGDWSSDVCSSDLTPSPARARSSSRPMEVAASSTTRASSPPPDRKSTRLNSSHLVISYAVFCLKKKMFGTLFASIILKLFDARTNEAMVTSRTLLL